VSPEELRDIREEITALRLAAQASQQRIMERLDELEALILRRTAKPGWWLYSLLAIAAFVGWIMPR
jgi:hypothetical protein